MLFSVVMTAIMVSATDYTDQIKVLVNGEGMTQSATISVTEHDGLYDLNLKNFTLMNEESPLPVGNVELKNLTPLHAGEAVILRAIQNVTITDGDDPDVTFWMGSMLGELPVQLTAVLEGDELMALITLDLVEILGQFIEVRFGRLLPGRGITFPNGSFEDWHTSTGKYMEPNAWHSFESATGTLASMAGHHLERSENAHSGDYCARIYSTSVFGVVANGTMTTGRMNAASMSAANEANNAYLDMSKTDVDGNGDPFYLSLNACPDSLVLWLQFKQTKANPQHPYATVSAAITDGTYYQDPEDKEYTNWVAKAANRQIAVTNGEWVRFSMPFGYSSSAIDPKALLVTISTNADPGQGNSADEVLIDDISLVYNAYLTSLNVPEFQSDKFEYTVGQEMSLDEIVAEATTPSAYVAKTIVNGENGKAAVITVLSADLASTSTYTINFKTATDIISVATVPTADPVFYSLGGQQLRSPRPGQVYIVRQADGSMTKVLR